MRNIKFLFASIIAITLSACMQTEFDNIELSNDKKWTTTHTIAEFIAEFATTVGDLPVRPNSGTANLFSVDTIPTIGDSIVISGVVISSDIEGNLYKNFIIQDTITGDALKVSVDVGSISGIMPVGQFVSIRCNGLAIGKYGDLLQLGTAYYNNDSEAGKRGNEIGRIPYSLFKVKSQIIGLPKSQSIKVDTMTIDEIKASNRSVHSKIVCIKNVKFNGYGEVGFFEYKKLNASELYFGLPKPPLQITGVPISREIQDDNGNKIYVSTSEYSKFASKPLPNDNEYGNITVIVGWYRDNVTRAGNWQLNMRSIEDLGKGFESYHTRQKK